MGREQRRDSARSWVQSGARVTVRTYAKRYGVDKYTAYDDLTAIGLSLPVASDQWARRPPSAAKAQEGGADAGNDGGDDGWIMVDGRPFFVAGYTSGGAPYGVFEDEEFSCSVNDERNATVVARRAVTTGDPLEAWPADSSPSARSTDRGLEVARENGSRRLGEAIR
jgi:hypothetical protein